MRPCRSVSVSAMVENLACALPGALNVGGWWGTGIVTGNNKLKVSCDLTISSLPGLQLGETMTRGLEKFDV